MQTVTNPTPPSTKKVAINLDTGEIYTDSEFHNTYSTSTIGIVRYRAPAWIADKANIYYTDNEKLIFDLEDDFKHKKRAALYKEMGKLKDKLEALK